MSLLQTTPECGEEDALCKWVLDQTQNEWLAAASDWLIAKPLQILLLLVVALFARWLFHRLIDRVTKRAAEGLPTPVLKHKPAAEQRHVAAVVASRRVQRAETMGSLLKSIASAVILTIFAITVIAELGFAVGPLIASAGIVGIALGFGAQSLVSDFLSGIFMIFEDQYGVGDVVDLGEAIGTVEAVGLRVTRLRDINGTVWYVRNGEILRVGNQSQNWARTVLDVPVGYGEDIPRVRHLLQEIADGMWEDDEFRGQIIEKPEVWGVQDLGPEAVVVRVAMKTAPLEQWGVAREMRQRIKARFDYEGIEIPLPQRVVWHRQEPPMTTLESPTGAPEQSGAPGSS